VSAPLSRRDLAKVDKGGRNRVLVSGQAAATIKQLQRTDNLTNELYNPPNSERFPEGNGGPAVPPGSGGGGSTNIPGELTIGGVQPGVPFVYVIGSNVGAWPIELTGSVLRPNINTSTIYGGLSSSITIDSSYALGAAPDGGPFVLSHRDGGGATPVHYAPHASSTFATPAPTATTTAMDRGGFLSSVGGDLYACRFTSGSGNPGTPYHYRNGIWASRTAGVNTYAPQQFTEHFSDPSLRFSAGITNNATISLQTGGWGHHDALGNTLSQTTGASVLGGVPAAAYARDRHFLLISGQRSTSGSATVRYRIGRADMAAHASTEVVISAAGGARASSLSDGGIGALVLGFTCELLVLRSWPAVSSSYGRFDAFFDDVWAVAMVRPDVALIGGRKAATSNGVITYTPRIALVHLGAQVLTVATQDFPHLAGTGTDTHVLNAAAVGDGTGVFQIRAAQVSGTNTAGVESANALFRVDGNQMVTN
jgi:hypothetical protein